ncbi:hypothetical protein [Dubosiella newyorkensis]|uniref:hypothetical protein n=1 Tax=Dubosiella newyorkensis TaxID=1862672 RepID=UPI003F666019
MVELDAEEGHVYSEQKIRAEEVHQPRIIAISCFRHYNLFSPKVVKEIWKKFDAVSEKEVPITPETADELDINDKGK